MGCFKCHIMLSAISARASHQQDMVLTVDSDVVVCTSKESTEALLTLRKHCHTLYSRGLEVLGDIGREGWAVLGEMVRHGHSRMEELEEEEQKTVDKQQEPDDQDNQEVEDDQEVGGEGADDWEGLEVDEDAWWRRVEDKPFGPLFYVSTSREVMVKGRKEDLLTILDALILIPNIEWESWWEVKSPKGSIYIDYDWGTDRWVNLEILDMTEEEWEAQFEEKEGKEPKKQNEEEDYDYEAELSIGPD